MSFSSSYSRIERFLHYFAFTTPLVQRVLADLESDLFKRELQGVVSRDEVFVTGLPRSGTTLVLELLFSSGGFRTFTYRNMPFILAPLLWDRLSRSFQKKGTSVERAHGDGMEISFDSPEAFEEVIWLSYLKDTIVNESTLSTLTAESVSAEFSTAMQETIRKILALSGEAAHSVPAPRYLSKNNANLSRIDALNRMFPTSTILVLFRNPSAHIGSLRSQHERFLVEHEGDAFSRNYMKWIGHYEFGENFKPINFSGWLDKEQVPSQVDSSFWLRYWIEAYSYVLKHKTSNVHFIDFDKLLSDGTETLGRIADITGLSERAVFAEGARKFRAPTTKPVENDACPQESWAAAREIHEQLKAMAI